jgi:uncharacterized protein DUF4953
MNKNTFTRASLTLGAVTMVVASFGGFGACVSARPARNGVFNENQYLRKDFLVRGADGKADPGWIVKATVLRTSTPNPLGNDPIGIFPGTESAGYNFGNSYVRFRTSQDKLELVDMRELSALGADPKMYPNDTGRVPEVVNSWPVTHVDLKYRVNLDGETTNFYEENQELNWQDRQWVKINWAKNDMSDVAVLGPGVRYWFDRCVDTAGVVATLSPDGYKYDPDKSPDYFQFVVQITAPLKLDDPACSEAYDFTSQSGNGSSLADRAGRLGKYNVTFDLMYSFMRANPNPDYLQRTFVLGEKDAIRHKYGPIPFATVGRDPDTGLLTARELLVRFDPTKPIVWYFAEGFPEKYKVVFTGPNGIKDQTNKLLEDAGVQARVEFKNFDEGLGEGEAPRQYGDARYSFIRWISDFDTQDSFAGVTQWLIDPRSGEVLSASISLNDFEIKDAYIQRLDAYLKSVGASPGINARPGDEGTDMTGQWEAGPCQDGDTKPIVDEKVKKDRIANDTVFSKMQEYLGRPVGVAGPLGPEDFIAQQDPDFFQAYERVIPYYVFADPEANAFVRPEGGTGVLGPGEIAKALTQEADFHALASKIDHGESPYQASEGKQSLINATNFLNTWRNMTLNHNRLQHLKRYSHMYVMRDAPEQFSFLQIIAKDARHCVNGHFETKEEWTQNFIDSYWAQVLWHEFGHAMGLDHNFMASVDRSNYQHFKDAQGRDHIGMYSSTVMEYNARPDRGFWGPATGNAIAFSGGWGPWDKGTISWLYANDGKIRVPCDSNAQCQQYPDTECKYNEETAKGALRQEMECLATGAGINGQANDKFPWKDPNGFTTDGKNMAFMFCDAVHERYTPLCREGDSGATPSEMIANQLDAYEWQYQWRNFRQYRKIWDDSRYADGPAELVVDLRRFLSMWAFDWSGSELVDTLRRVGIKNPDPSGSDQDYYNQLVNKFNLEASRANQMVAAFAKAVIQQSSGERPYRTTYDKFFGDVNQQGIIIDKLFAMVGWVGLWPTDNYDQNQAGFYLTSYGSFGEAGYRSVSEDAVESMIGGQYNVYPYFPPLAVALFAQDTHDPSFLASAYRPEVRDWIGGKVFYREEDFLKFFRRQAVALDAFGCTNIDTCPYDPQIPQEGVTDIHHSDPFNEFIGPDGRRWAWAYVTDRNTWVAVDRDRNTASYLIVRSYNQDVINQQDDGAFPGGAYYYQHPMKYFLDAFEYYN